MINPFVYDLPVKVARVTPRYANVEALPLPCYQKPGDAGMDLMADIDQTIGIRAGETRLIPTGLKFEIPEGFEGQIRSRSGLASKKNLVVINSPGTIDSGYRGEVMVALRNFSTDTSFAFIARGERIAQLVFAPVTRVELKLVEDKDLSNTDRGTGGFGSTGV